MKFNHLTVFAFNLQDKRELATDTKFVVWYLTKQEERYKEQLIINRGTIYFMKLSF